MEFLIDIAITVIVAKLFADLFERFRFPELVGCILAGFLLGPIVGIVNLEHIRPFGEIGLILLLFIAGFEEIRMEEVLKHRYVCLAVGIIGSIVSFASVFYLIKWYGYNNVEAAFAGAALMATSISISIGSLLKSRKLNTEMGKITLGSAIIDDIVGLLALAVVVNMGSTGHFPTMIEFGQILFGMVVFFAIFIVCGLLFPRLVKMSRFLIVEEARFSLTLVLILVLAWLAEVFGLSSVLGAFLAGIILSRVPELETKKFIEKINVTSEGIFIPLFFAMIGMQLYVSSGVLEWFTLFILLIVIATKFIPTFIIAKIAKLKKSESFALSLAMIPRGEVTLIILLLGRGLGVVPGQIFSAIVLVIIATTFLIPMALRPILSKV